MNFASATDVQKFSEWLVSQGCEILPITNEWEVLRFKCGRTMGIAWKSKKSGTRVSTANRHAKACWDAWKNGKPFPLTGKPKRRKRTKSDQIVDAIVERDGDGCWFCGRAWDEEHPQTLEHLVPIAHGGPNHLSNMVLACQPCNTRAGHLSVAEKVELRNSQHAFIVSGAVQIPQIDPGEIKYLSLADAHDGGAS